MTEQSRGRGIRDIAHLYLSRRPRQSQATALELWVAGENRACLPGCHVANLAAALAMRDLRVRVVELSGLLPNAAFYFNLPPDVYLNGDGKAESALPGLNSISVGFSAEALPAAGNGAAASIDVIHLPTLDDGRSLASVAESAAQNGAVADRRALLIERQPSESAPFEAWLEPDAVFRLGLEALPVAPYSRGHLGAVSGWEAFVNDRLPRVARDPECTLARDYLSIIDSMLSRIRSARRGRDAESPVSGRFGNRSRNMSVRRQAETKTTR